MLEAQAVGLKCVASNVIPKEVQVTKLLHKLDLKDDDSIWTETILKYKNNKRKSQHDIIKKSGYDIQENAYWLMKFYLNAEE